MRTRPVTVALTALALAAAPITLLAGSAEAATTWSTPTAVTSSANIIGNSSVAMSADGTVVFTATTVSSGGQSYVQVMVSNDGGITWAQPVRVTAGSATAYTYSMKVSSDGTHGTIAYDNGAVVSATSTTDSGKTWSTPVAITDPAGAAASVGDVALGMSTDGTKLYAAWWSNEANDVIRVASSANSGTTWTSPGSATRVSPSNYSADSDPQIQVSADGEYVGVAWLLLGGVSNSALQYAYTNDAGANWSNPTSGSALSGSGVELSYFSIGIDSTGTNVVAAWEVNVAGPNNMQSVRSSNGGGTWSPIVSVLANTQSSGGITMVTAPTNGLTVMSWYDNSAAGVFAIKAASSTDYGLSWTTSTVNDTAVQVADPSVAVAQDGKSAQIVWRIGNPSGSVGTSTTTDAGLTWTSQSTLSGSATDAVAPMVGLSSDANWRLVSFIDSVNTRLMSTRSAPAPTVTVVAPSTGYVFGGDAITITGTGFNTGATVKIGGTAATSVKVASSTSITAVAPAANAAGKADVVVTNVDGQAATLTGGWTYSALKTQAPAKDLKIAKKIKPRVWTKLIKVPVRMNTGQSAPPVVTPSIKGKAVGHVSKKLFKTKRKNGYLQVWSSGKKPVKVLLSLYAPPIEEYGEYNFSKTYSIKKG